jgi:DNA-binding MarR family transcriptional regulator
MVVDQQDDPLASILRERSRAIAFIRALLASRRSFEERLAGGHFADGARDILLYLFLSELEGHCVTVSAAAAAGAVPVTTAMRHLYALQENGLIRRSLDRGDRRRAFIHLTDNAREQIAAWLMSTTASLVRSLQVHEAPPRPE